MSTAFEIAGRIYPAKSAKLELIDLIKEQIHAGYQSVDRASITRPVLDRVVADLEHAVLLLDALQDERDARGQYERGGNMSSWQPMETAPRDGSVVLGCQGNGDEYEVFEMVFDSSYGWRDPKWDGGFYPIAWMPRPPAPSAS